MGCISGCILGLGGVCILHGESTMAKEVSNRSRFWGRGCDEALFSEKKGFSLKRGEFGKDFYRKGSSVKRFRPFSEPPDSEN